MRLDQFPVPVTLLADELVHDARILVHRRTAADHEDSEHCACKPHSFTRVEVSSLTCEALNSLLSMDVN